MSQNINNIYANLNTMHSSFSSMVSSLMSAINEIQSVPPQKKKMIVDLISNSSASSQSEDDDYSDETSVSSAMSDNNQQYYEKVWYKYFAEHENQYTYAGKAVYVPVDEVKNGKYLNNLVIDLNIERQKLGLATISFNDVGGWFIERENFLGYQFKPIVLELFPHLKHVTYLNEFNVKPKA
jgi:hypothetical protein